MRTGRVRQDLRRHRLRSRRPATRRAWSKRDAAAQSAAALTRSRERARQGGAGRLHGRAIRRAVT